MSELTREKRLETPNAGTARTDLKLNSASVNVTSNYQRVITLNPGTEFEERLIADNQQVSEQMHFDTQSDEQFADLLNLEATVKDLVVKNSTEIEKKYAVKGAPAQAPVEQQTEKVATSKK